MTRAAEGFILRPKTLRRAGARIGKMMRRAAARMGETSR
jgi:hypothetical protein